MSSNLWTSSRLSATRRCLRLAHNRFGLGLGEPQSEVARFGTVGHAAIEAGLLAYGQPEPWRLRVALDACDALGDAYERARVRAAIVGYWLRWGGEPWEILAVEQEFRFMLGEYEIGGKIDALVREPNGSTWVLEHKFTAQDASPGAVYWERLTIDTQVSIYVDGAAFLGHGEIAGVIYDVINKPLHKPALATPADKRKTTIGKGCQLCGGKARGVQGSGLRGADPTQPCAGCQGTGWRIGEGPQLYAGQRDADEHANAFEARILEAIAKAPDDFYRRGKVVRLVDELPKMRADILDTIKLARVADLFDIHPRNSDACAKFGARSLCGFFDACTGRADINDPIRFPRGTAHPELAATHPNV